MAGDADSRVPQGNGRWPTDPSVLLSNGANPFAAEALHLRDMIGILRRRWLVVLLVTVAMAGGAAAWLWARPRLYQATAAVLIVDARRSLAGPILDEPTWRGVGRMTDPIRSHMQVLQGRTVLGQAVDREGLRLVPGSSDFPHHLLSVVSVAETTAVDHVELSFDPQRLTARAGLGEAWAGYGEVVEVGGVRFTVAAKPTVAAATLQVLPRELAIDRLANRLRVLHRTGSDVIEVSYTSTDPLEAQRVVNTSVEVFQSHNVQMVQQQTTLRRQFLENQLRTTDSELAAAHEALNRFRQSRQLYRSADQISAHQQALMNLDLQRAELGADRGMYRSLLDALRSSVDGGRSSAIRTLVSAPGIAANAVVTQLYGQLVAYESRREELATGVLGSTGQHPDVERLDRLIASTEEKLLDASQSHVASLDARLAALDELRNRKLEEIQVLPGAETEEALLLQDIRTVSTLADAIRADLQRSRMAEAIETGQVEILYWAPPGKPIYAARRKRVILAMILGVMFGSGAAFALEFMDGTLRRRREVETVLRLRCLAVIPPLVDRNRAHPLLTRLRRFRPMVLRQPGGLATVRTIGAARGPGEAGGAEAFRRLDNSLFLPTPGGPAKTLMVTSPSSGDGKTVTSANLGLTLARHGRRVLLVDMDLRRPGLHEIFQMPLRPGVSDVLVGQVAPFDAVRSSDARHLSVLPAGQWLPEAYDPFQVAALREFLEALVGAFDVVILDTPPVLAVADAINIAMVSDGVLLVLRAGNTRPASALQTVEELSRVGAHLVGAVLVDRDNKVLEDSCSYDYRPDHRVSEGTG
jgi:polysaccharide biosynthesis transport protein